MKVQESLLEDVREIDIFTDGLKVISQVHVYLGAIFFSVRIKDSQKTFKLKYQK